MKRGGVYLVVIMGWHSRSVLAWRLSSTMDAEFRVAALEEAINRHGVPEIFNRDRGLQVASQEFTQAPKDAGGAISMDGNGRWVDNLMIKRIWRSVKWECLYLREVETGSQALKYQATGFSSITSSARIQLLMAVGQWKYTVG